MVNQVRLKLALLGVTSTAAEDADLESHDPTLMVDALASMFARASQNGQYGVRQVVYRSGYSDRERDFIAKYRLIRGDTTVASLRASTVFARPTSVTALDSAVTREGVARSNRLFLGFLLRLFLPLFLLFSCAFRLLLGYPFFLFFDFTI